MALIRCNKASGDVFLAKGDILKMEQNTAVKASYTSGTAFTQVRSNGNSTAIALRTGTATVAVTTSIAAYISIVGVKDGAIVSQSNTSPTAQSLSYSASGCDYVLIFAQAGSGFDYTVTVTDA